jgi:hypothetical protein
VPDADRYRLGNPSCQPIQSSPTRPVWNATAAATMQLSCQIDTADAVIIQAQAM